MIVSDGRTPKRFFENERNWENVGAENRRLLTEFEREKVALDMSEGARYMYLFCLVKLAKHFKGKPFKSLTKAAIIDFFEHWKDYKSPSLKVSVKAFYKWLNKAPSPAPFSARAFRTARGNCKILRQDRGFSPFSSLSLSDESISLESSFRPFAMLCRASAHSRLLPLLPAYTK